MVKNIKIMLVDWTAFISSMLLLRKIMQHHCPKLITVENSIYPNGKPLIWFNTTLVYMISNATTFKNNPGIVVIEIALKSDSIMYKNMTLQGNRAYL